MPELSASKVTRPSPSNIWRSMLKLVPEYGNLSLSKLHIQVMLRRICCPTQRKHMNEWFFCDALFFSFPSLCVLSHILTDFRTPSAHVYQAFSEAWIHGLCRSNGIIYIFWCTPRPLHHVCWSPSILYGPNRLLLTNASSQDRRKVVSRMKT